MRAIFTIFSMLMYCLPAQAQTNSFDPSVCALENDGKIAVQLHPSGRAFLLPPEGFYLRGGGGRAAVPGEAPLGCPDNPLRTGSISFPLQYEAMLAARRGEAVEWPKLVSFALFGHDGPMRIRGGNYILLLRRAEDSTCEPVTSEFGVCYSCRRHPDAPEFCAAFNNTVGDRRVEYRSKTYFSSTAEGAIPADPHYQLQCDSAFPPGDEPPFAQRCEARFELIDGVWVRYELDLVGRDETSLLDFDTAIRNEILSHRAPALDQEIGE